MAKASSKKKKSSSKSKSKIKASASKRPRATPAKVEVGQRLHTMFRRGTYVDKIGIAPNWYGLLFDTGVPGADYAIVAETARGLSGFTAYRTAADARKMFNQIEKSLGAHHGNKNDR